MMLMVWGGICHAHWTQLQIIHGNPNPVRYRDEILGPIVAPFVHQHNITFQHTNTWPHVVRLCTQFLEPKTSLFFCGLPIHQTCPLLSSCGMFWTFGYVTMFQSLRISMNSARLLWRNGTIFCKLQLIISFNLCDSICTALQNANDGYTRYWKYNFEHWPHSVYYSL